MKFIKNLLIKYHWTKAKKSLDNGDINKHNKHQMKVYHSIWSKYMEPEF